MKELRSKFVSPVYPGEALTMKFWVDNANVIFEVSVPERKVINCVGTAVLG